MFNQLNRIMNINGHVAHLVITWDGEAQLHGEFGYKRSKIPTKVGARIMRETKRLLEEYREENQELEVWCTPYTSDGYGAERERAFKWAGFVFDPDKDIWILP